MIFWKIELFYYDKRREILNKQKEQIGQSIYYLPVLHFELEQFPLSQLQMYQHLQQTQQSKQEDEF